jgi:putative polyketide hydroxylase
MKQHRTPVLIVGGGLTGLSAAVFLAHHGIAATLVERHPDTSTHPKARAINPRTMELYRAVGMEERVRAGRSPISGNTDLVHVESLAGKERVRMPSASPEDIGRISPTQWTLIDQNQLEPILRERAVEAGADVRFSTRVDGLQEDAEGVLAHTTDLSTGESSQIHARYVIAADGSRSPLREMLGIGAHGRGTITDLVSFFFEADLTQALRGRRIIAAYVNNPEVRGTVIPIDNDRRWVINVSFFPEQGQRAEDFTEERCTALVRAAVGVPDLPLKIESADMPAWDISARVADTFATRRVFVAGDAAHVMPPTGAFGASTGIQDAYNLAWKLALVLSGAAGPGLLESYAEGYAIAHAEAAVPVDPELNIRSSFRLQDGYDAIRSLLDRGIAFDAVFALTDVVAMGALRALADAGLRVPDDVQVVGFDDIDEAAYLVPSLSSVNPGHDEMADRITALLTAQITGGPTGDPKEIVVPARLVARGTTKPPA